MLACLVERVADAIFAMRAGSLASSAAAAAFVHQQPRAGAADLALVEEDAVDQAFDAASRSASANTM